MGPRETVGPTKGNMKVKVNYLTEREIDSDLYLFVEKLMGLRNEKKQWEAIDEIVSFYKKNYTDEYNDTVLLSRDLRKTRGDEWGRGDLKKDTGKSNFRMVMNLPFRLITIIRKVYGEQDLPFDRVFLRKFGMKHPEFLVPEKGYKTISN